MPPLPAALEGWQRDLWALPHRWLVVPLKLQASVGMGQRGHSGRGDGDNGGGGWGKGDISLSQGLLERLRETRETGKAGYSAERWGGRVPIAHPRTAGETSAQPFIPELAATSREQAQPKHTVGGSETLHIA